MFLKKVRIIINGKDVKGSDLGLFQLFWYFLEQTGPIEGLKILTKGSSWFTRCIHVNIMNMKLGLAVCALPDYMGYIFTKLSGFMK